MISQTTQRFRACYDELPAPVKRRARRAFEVFKRNPFHTSLRFKQIHATRPIFSVRVSLGYRALGIRDGDQIIWFWIGSHADYDRLVSSL